MIQSMATGVGCLALLLFVCCQTSTADAFLLPGFPGSGETRPPSGGDTNYLKEGEKLEITCELTNVTWQQSCNASHMSLRLYKPDDPEPYFVGTQTPLGPYTIRLLVEKASANESGIYYCFCNDTTISFTRVKFSIGG